MCGGVTKEGFIQISNCLSLNDTFWVKSSEEDVTWDRVNLYDNEFSDVVSKLAFDGTGLFGERFSTTSPEFTTDGAFDKCWVRRNGVIKLLKSGSTGASNAGRELYSEKLASQVFVELLGSNAVRYSVEQFDGRVVSVCNLFTSKDRSYLPHSVYLRSRPTLPELIDEFDKYDCLEQFMGMIIGDCITINTDRHYKNFGWFVEHGTSNRLAMAPVFDFNMAMATYADDIVGFNDFDAYIADHAPVIGSDYFSPTKALLTPNYRAKLINLKDLWLSVPCDDKFTEDRLKKINVIKNVQIDRILGRQAQFYFG